jgi:putative oligomerization/nucleic acid binding protein
MPGLLRGVARTAVVAGTATAVSGRVARRQQGRWAAKEQAAAEEAPPPAAAPEPQYQEAPPQAAAPSTDDRLAQLKQLGELRDAGVLTDAEFEAQKGKILYGS